MKNYQEVKKPIACRFVFKRKRGANRSITKFKARLVAKGFRQIKGTNFFETYSPVAKMSTLRIIIAIAAINGLYLHQIDFSTAYINADLEETIYMTPPPNMQLEKGYSLRLLKSIYGLKQAGLNWHLCISKFLMELGFHQCVSDTCTFVRDVNTESFVIIVLYVDDLIIGSKDLNVIKDLKRKIAQKYEIEDLNELEYYLGINIKRIEDGYVMSQKTYIEKLIAKHRLELAVNTSSPLPTTFKYDPDEINHLKPSQLQYVVNFPTRQIVGELNHIAIATRPDIAFAVNYIARFQDSPNLSTCKALRHILKFLNSTKDHHLKFSGRVNSLVGYSDADWAGDPINRKSTSGYIFYLGNSPISWQSRLQPTVALSTTEAEYIALTAASQEAIWIRSLLREWGLTMNMPTTIWSDNTGAIQITYSPTNHRRTKHIDIKFHYIRNLVKSNKIVVDKIHTSEMLADVLTKNVSTQVQLNLRDGLMGKGEIKPSPKRQRIYKKVLESVAKLKVRSHTPSNHL